MKKQRFTFLILLSILALGACDKYSSSSNLAGTWDITTMTQKFYTNGSLDSSNIQNDLGTFTFDSDGSGSYSVDDGDQTSSGSFDWFEQNDKVFLNMMNLSDSIMTKNFAIGFDVKTNTATEQAWTLSYSYYQTETNPASGNEVKYLKKTDIEIELAKQ